MDGDFLLAIQLQEQFDNEYETSLLSNSFEDPGQSSKKRKVEVAGGGGSDLVPYWKPTAQPERPLSIVDETWEMLDPNPDVRAMFLEFNDMFFWGKLSGVEVKWSPRMTLCAGVCSYEGRGGLCSIRLSEPLLKLRPRKDLVETLLHEMIHALLFVTQNNRDRDGHGPEFCKHMNRINDATGTKISIYHSFHDEVDVYRQHWWRCDGPCQNRKPYFGYVKRAMNRAPSSLDPWWGDHQRTCGGTYTKVKEPEGYGKKGKKDGKSLEKKGPGNGKPSGITAGSGLQDIRNIIPFSGKGFLLGGKSQPSTSSSSSPKPAVPVPKTSFNPPVPSPKKPFTPSPPTKILNSPVRFGADSHTISKPLPPVRPASSTGPKPPIKRSVSNTKVFVNINGSPVRISKSSSRSSGNQEANKIKQTSIEDLFSSLSQTSNSITHTKTDSANSSKSATSAPSFFTKQQSNNSAASPNILKSSPTKPSSSSFSSSGLKGSPVKPTQSKYFNSSNSDAASGAVSRKRPWDERGSSASILDLFQKTLGSDSAASREPAKTKSPALQQGTSTPTTSISSSSSSAAASSSSAVMVSCPVCQAKVQESKINQHLDSCLS
ncbi:DNA-dependent metalloprotease SPRTN [Xyrichtys novacula]|uniref:DNA-dependent metalloprotease SPRTN n=1 Tax=Xyrichtys novacula TaxID=13765 RepID=A0AAV1GZZ0_XYRNO|nr:DNA-dependent metalloprotease SPRTN [Xyrichtys novacula]